MTRGGTLMASRFLIIRAVVSVGVWLILMSGASAQAVVPAHSLLGLLNDLATRVTAAASGLPPVPLTGSSNIVAILTALEVSTAPLGTSTGGFTFKLDIPSGTFQ